MARPASWAAISSPSSATLPEPNSVDGRGAGSGTISAAATSSWMARARPTASASRSSTECTAAVPADPLPLPQAAPRRRTVRTGTSTTARMGGGSRSTGARRLRAASVLGELEEMAIPAGLRPDQHP